MPQKSVLQSAADVALCVFGIFLAFVVGAWFLGYFSLTQIVNHERACYAVAEYRKQTGTAGVKPLIDGDASAILSSEQTNVDGNTIGPWLQSGIAVEVLEDGTIQTQIGPWNIPCSFKLKIATH